MYPPPKPGLKGFWVKRRKFTGEKSFGRFHCGNCEKEWLSAHTFKMYKQACIECGEYIMSRYMWVNTESQEKQTPDDDGKPHRSDLCEACHKGVCRRMHSIVSIV
jgi:hypothetical protein